jgi:glycine cleavage system regulatory protein
MADLVLTFIGPDRPGLVKELAEPVVAHGGNWLESRMAQLAGQFAGILRVEVPDARASSLVDALRRLDTRGLRLVVEAVPAAPVSERRLVLLDLVGLDRPGIVREVSHQLASRGVNIEELLVTDRTTAPMTAEPLFRSHARLHVPASIDLAELRTALERVANDLMVQITLAAAEQGR